MVRWPYGGETKRDFFISIRKIFIALKIFWQKVYILVQNLPRDASSFKILQNCYEKGWLTWSKYTSYCTRFANLKIARCEYFSKLAIVQQLKEFAACGKKKKHGETNLWRRTSRRVRPTLTGNSTLNFLLRQSPFHFRPYIPKITFFSRPFVLFTPHVFSSAALSLFLTRCLGRGPQPFTALFPCGSLRENRVAITIDSIPSVSISRREGIGPITSGGRSRVRL